MQNADDLLSVHLCGWLKKTLTQTVCNYERPRGLEVSVNLLTLILFGKVIRAFQISTAHAS